MFNPAKRTPIALPGELLSREEVWDLAGVQQVVHILHEAFILAKTKTLRGQERFKSSNSVTYFCIDFAGREQQTDLPTGSGEIMEHL